MEKLQSLAIDIKHSVFDKCLVTGKISNQNLSLFNGKIHLSPKGAEQLLKELQKYLKHS